MKVLTKTSWFTMVCLMMLTCSCTSTSSSNGVNNISAEELNTFIESGKGILVDVRTPAEYAKGFIAEAKNIGFYGDDFNKQILLLPKEEAIYLYCHSGNRSGKAAKFLVENGYTKVYNLVGGYSSYK